MSEIEVRPGDHFCTWNPDQSIIGAPIRWITSWNAIDCEARYSHSGLIVDDRGTTFEAGIKIEGYWGHRIGMQDLFFDYAGLPVIIVRHDFTTFKRFQKAFAPLLALYCNKLYPYWRLPVFLYPPVARRLNLKKVGVCSELVAQYRYREGTLPRWMGVVPDYLADIGHNWFGAKGFRTVFEGTLPDL